MSVLAVIGIAMGMAACSRGRLWDQPGRTISTDRQGETNSMMLAAGGKIDRE